MLLALVTIVWLASNEEHLFWGSSMRKFEVLEFVHIDVCGLIEVKTSSRGSYSITFIDDTSRMV